MEIRTAIIEDAEAILAMQRLAYQSEAANYDFTIRPLTETLEDIKDRFHDRRFLKAIEDGQIFSSVRALRKWQLRSCDSCGLTDGESWIGE